MTLGKTTLIATSLAVQIGSDKQTDHYFFAHLPGELSPVGMLVVGIEEGENAGWISRVFVEPAARKNGVATFLLGCGLDLCRKQERLFASLTVANDNEEAQRVYKALGFEPFMKGQEGHTQYICKL